MNNIQCITTESDFYLLIPEWEALKGSNPFLDQNWLGSWWQAFHGAHSLYVVVGRDGAGEVDFIAPWYLHKSKSRGKEIRFLGSGQVCSDYMSLLSHEGCSPELVNELADWLIAKRDWDCIRFDGVCEDDPWISALNTALVARGATSRSTDQESFWRLELPSTYDQYLAQCQKKIRQKLRKVERDTLGRVTFDVVRDSSEVGPSLERLIDLHGRRRTELGDSGCFVSKEFLEFIKLVAKRFHATGQLWLGQLEIDGQPAASCFAIESDRILYFYQTGANPDFANLQPGWLMNTQLIQRAIDSGITAIDYLRGDEPYKARLSAKPTKHVRIQLASSRRSSQLRSQLWEAGVSLKKLAFNR